MPQRGINCIKSGTIAIAAHTIENQQIPEMECKAKVKPYWLSELQFTPLVPTFAMGIRMQWEHKGSQKPMVVMAYQEDRRKPQ